jgi:hypothetical protein
MSGACIGDSGDVRCASILGFDSQTLVGALKKAREDAMGKINGTRVLLGGLLAGVIFNVLYYGAAFLYLGKRWSAALEALGHPICMSGLNIAIGIVFDFVLGIFAVWLYALIRPRCGAGAKTALFAGMAFWVLTGLLPTIMWGSLKLFSARLLTIDSLSYLVMVIVATLLGAWVYKEEAP